MKMKPELSICSQKPIYQTNSLPILEEKFEFWRICLTSLPKYLLDNIQSIKIHPLILYSSRLSQICVKQFIGLTFERELRLFWGEQLAAASTTAGARFKDICFNRNIHSPNLRLIDFIFISWSSFQRYICFNTPIHPQS